MSAAFRDVAVVMLLTNALWNFLAGAAIVLYMQFGCLRPLAEMHTALWTKAEDQANAAAMILMSVLMFQWSFTRGFAAMDFDTHWPDAAYSYWVEGALIGLCTVSGRMQLGKGVCVVFLCFCCWELVVMAGMGEI